MRLGSKIKQLLVARHLEQKQQKQQKQQQQQEKHKQQQQGCNKEQNNKTISMLKKSKKKLSKSLYDLAPRGQHQQQQQQQYNNVETLVDEDLQSATPQANRLRQAKSEWNVTGCNENINLRYANSGWNVRQPSTEDDDIIVGQHAVLRKKSSLEPNGEPRTRAVSDNISDQHSETGSSHSSNHSIHPKRPTSIQFNIPPSKNRTVSLLCSNSSGGSIDNFEDVHVPLRENAPQVRARRIGRVANTATGLETMGNPSSTPTTPFSPVTMSTPERSVGGAIGISLAESPTADMPSSLMSTSNSWQGSTLYIAAAKPSTERRTSKIHALKSLSRSTPAMSPSASPRHSDSEGVPRVSKATKKFMRHFASDAPKTERVLNYYSCALVADILLQGTLYITPNYFAFYSKIFGHVSRLLIPIVQVSVVQKERTAKIIPNAVGLQTLDGKSYVFGSLLSRDSTYKLMNHCWKKAQKLADSDSEPASQVNAVADDEEEDEEDESGSNSAEEDDSLNDEPDAAPSAPLPATPTIWVPGGTTISNTSTIASLTSQLSSTPTSTSPNSTSGGLKQPMLVASSPKLVEDMLRRSSTESNRNKLNTLKEEPGGGGANDVGVIDYITQGTLVKTCWRFGSVPVKLVSEGIKELWSLPRTSLLLIISTFMLVLLFASAAFMLYRVDTLSQQMTIQKQPSDYDIMYEEVLQMQQRLHNAASVEIERTLTNQLKLISTVRKSLEAMTVLLHNEPAGTPAQIPDAT